MFLQLYNGLVENCKNAVFFDEFGVKYLEGRKKVLLLHSRSDR